MSKLTKASFINYLSMHIETACSPPPDNSFGHSENYSDYVNGIQRRAKDSGILVGDTSGLENPVVYCIEQLARSVSRPSLSLRNLTAIEAAWEHYEKNI